MEFKNKKGVIHFKCFDSDPQIFHHFDAQKNEWIIGDSFMINRTILPRFNYGIMALPERKIRGFERIQNYKYDIPLNELFMKIYDQDNNVANLCINSKTNKIVFINELFTALITHPNLIPYISEEPEIGIPIALKNSKDETLGYIMAMTDFYNIKTMDDLIEFMRSCNK